MTTGQTYANSGLIGEGKYMTARYAGRCEACGAWMNAGTEIWYSFSSRKASHADKTLCDRKVAASVVAGDEPAPIASVPWIPDGRYTVVFPDGDYRTLKVTWQTDGKFAGMSIVEYLMGQDNAANYIGFAFLKADGRVAVWKRYKDADDLQRAVAVLADRTRAEEAGLAYAMASSRCRHCGRDLTVPASLHRGYGPKCAEQLGIE